jgi:nitroreductase
MALRTAEPTTDGLTAGRSRDLRLDRGPEAPLPPAEQPHWDAVCQIIRRRRSNLRVDPERAVPRELLDELLELACWAPNHKHTHPWRFAIVTGTARARLGALAAQALQSLGITQPAALEKARQKYLRAPVILVVGSAAHPVPYLHRENRDAVAAGVQNLLLAATARGLASFWSTGAPAEDAAVKAFAGLEAQDEIVALIYLGWPVEEAPAAQRAAPVVSTIDS